MTDQSLHRVVELLRGFVTSAHSSPSVIHAVIICLRRFVHVTFAHFWSLMTHSWFHPVESDGSFSQIYFQLKVIDSSCIQIRFGHRRGKAVKRRKMRSRHWNRCNNHRNRRAAKRTTAASSRRISCPPDSLPTGAFDLRKFKEVGNINHVIEYRAPPGTQHFGLEEGENSTPM